MRDNYLEVGGRKYRLFIDTPKAEPHLCVNVYDYLLSVPVSLSEGIIVSVRCNPGFVILPEDIFEKKTKEIKTLVKELLKWIKEIK